SDHKEVRTTWGKRFAIPGSAGPKMTSGQRGDLSVARWPGGVKASCQGQFVYKHLYPMVSDMDEKAGLAVVM
ncbi:MAG TPA: hypothetical protein PK250_14650, partial [Syntrophobacter fumaroxidans]|nr:hypothetical protein [Syntrophobacter fumaroxidans]